MSTTAGNRKTAAARLGISYVRYRELIGKGRKYCSQCGTWKPASQFYHNPTRPDQLDTTCIQCGKTNSKIQYRKRKAKK